MILEALRECRRGKFWLVSGVTRVNEFDWEVRFELKCDIMGS